MLSHETRLRRLPFLTHTRRHACVMYGIQELDIHTTLKDYDDGFSDSININPNTVRRPTTRDPPQCQPAMQRPAATHTAAAASAVPDNILGRWDDRTGKDSGKTKE